MAMTWEETELVFPLLRERAIEQGTCFCKCGCRAEGVAPVSRFERIEPGICGTCTKSRAQYLHERATGPASIYRDPEEDEAPKAAPTPSTPEERSEAIAYLTGYGDGPTPLVERLLKRLDSYKTLTDAEVRSALRSKAADARYAQRVMERTERRPLKPRVRRVKPPVRVHIPKTVPEGDYAISDGLKGWVMVRVERPKVGYRKGWTVVRAAADLEMVEVGRQRPMGFLNAFTGTLPAYEGTMPRALALLISNPAKAAADYRQLMEVPE